MQHVWTLIAAAACLAAPQARAAIGCTLNNPARDLKALYPRMTSYREDVKEIGRLPDGRQLYEELRARLSGDLDPVYETRDTPYTVYTIFEGTTTLGYVHGVNVAGRGGVIQIFLAVHPETAAIERMFYQRLEGPGATALRNPAVTSQFTSLTLADFYRHDYYAVVGYTGTVDRIAQLSPPPTLPPAAVGDWEATVRGVRKNLVLLDLFVFGRRHEPFYRRAVEARENASQKQKEVRP